MDKQRYYFGGKEVLWFPQEYLRYDNLNPSSFLFQKKEDAINKAIKEYNENGDDYAIISAYIINKNDLYENFEQYYGDQVDNYRPELKQFILDCRKHGILQKEYNEKEVYQLIKDIIDGEVDFSFTNNEFLIGQLTICALNCLSIVNNKIIKERRNNGD